jgi:hypothetical protein
MFNVKTLLVFISAVTLLFSCKKDDTNGGGGNTNCRATKVVYFEGTATPYDSAVYTYTGDKVTKVQLDGANYTLEYSGNNITKRNFFTSAGATPDLYDVISYNPDNTISKIETFYKSGSTYVLFWRTDFAYTGGKVSKVTNYEVTNNVSTGYDEYTFTYTGNNITTVAYRDLENPGSPAQNITYAYDNNPNYFKKQNSQFFLIDAFFIDPEIYLFLPMIFSENNVTSITGGAGGVNVSYELDNNQNLVNYRITQAGTQFLRSQYTYTCN